MAQLVNVIAPIMTSDTGAWRQTIFYPLLHASTYGRGTVLQTLVDCPVYDSIYGDAPYLDCVAVINNQHNDLIIFAVNKDTSQDMEITCDLRQFTDYTIKEHIVLHDKDPEAVNTETDPDRIHPYTVSGTTSVNDGIL